MQVTTAWVAPPTQIGGLDHLAVQAPCVNIYSQLLPGITNVTDRARYYSFYPWLIWKLNASGYNSWDDRLIEIFRRADCLFSLVAERHAIRSEAPSENHSAAIVGRNTLGPVAANIEESGPINLSEFALRADVPNRYFMQKLGGLGQYYLGVLRELRILDGTTTNGVKFTREIGAQIAEKFDAGVDGALFLSLVEEGQVGAQDLDDLAAFCPCQLSENDGERDILADMFAARGLFKDGRVVQRRESLRLILDLAEYLNDTGEPLTVENFLGCVYSGSLPNQESISISADLENTLDKWKRYAANEVLSVAMQGLFFALLDAYEELGERLGSGAEIVDWFLKEPEIKRTISGLGSDQSFGELVEGAASWLPEIKAWRIDGHEMKLIDDIKSLTGRADKGQVRQEVFESSLKAFIALLHRLRGEASPYGSVTFEPHYLERYPLNLISLQRLSREKWHDWRVGDVLSWVLNHWGIDQHLKVALRKLRGQSQSTFRVRPSDRGMEIVSVPPATGTQPRIRQSIRILQDLGALEVDENNRLRPSEIGRTLIAP